MGGAALRGGALNNREVVEHINRDFVPVWVNARSTPLPDFPDREEVLMGTKLTEEGLVKDLGSQGFFLRIVVLDPEDLALLNRQAPTAAESVKTFTQEGHFAYAQAYARQVVPMLEAATASYAARRGG